MTEHLTAAQFREINKAEKHGRIPRSSKSKRTIGGIVFDSMAEAKRYVLLQDMVRAGRIKNLELQSPFEIIVNGHLVCRYMADFTYLNETGEMIVEDCKSRHTRKDPVYRLKAKLVHALYGITIKEYIA